MKHSVTRKIKVPIAKLESRCLCNDVLRTRFVKTATIRLSNKYTASKIAKKNTTISHASCDPTILQLSFYLPVYIIRRYRHAVVVEHRDEFFG